MRKHWAQLSLSFLLVAAAATGYDYGRGVAYAAGGTELVVPQVAGSAMDLTARLIADWLSKKWKEPVIIVNRPGGGMAVGTQYVMRAKPDGSIMLCDSGGVFDVLIKDQLPYKWGERTFIARILVGANAFVTSSSSPLKTLKDVEQRIRTDPGTFKSGWQAVTTGTGLTYVKWFRAIGVDPSKVKLVEYTSSNEAITAVAGGHIDFANGGTSACLPLWESGRIRMIGVTSDRRLKSFPDVPTVKEQGYDAGMVTAQGISGPLNLPKAVVDKWVSAISEMCADKDFAAVAEKQLQLYPSFLGPEDFRRDVLEQAREVESLAKRQ